MSNGLTSDGQAAAPWTTMRDAKLVWFLSVPRSVLCVPSEQVLCVLQIYQDA